jgi:hypothetical protein
MCHLAPALCRSMLAIMSLETYEFLAISGFGVGAITASLSWYYLRLDRVNKSNGSESYFSLSIKSFFDTFRGPRSLVWMLMAGLLLTVISFIFAVQLKGTSG